jgi:GDPmannose 4,6-dehydratase
MVENKRVICTGSNGQMGSYTTDLLKQQGYEVYGISMPMSKDMLYAIILEYKPSCIFNYAGFSNTFTPYDNTQENIDTNLVLPKNLLEIIYEVDPSIRFFQASSCLVFGKDDSGMQNEWTTRNPTYAYGICKNAADQFVKLFREEKGLFACSGILFPTESPRRVEGFFTKKIASAVARIKQGSKEKVKVGDLTQLRDWSYAPDVAEAAVLMLQADKAQDYVIGSGVLTSTEDFVQRCFKYVGLNYKDHIEYDEKLHRKNDFDVMRADTTKIKTELGWKPTHSIDSIISAMVDAELNKLRKTV